MQKPLIILIALSVIPFCSCTHNPKQIVSAQETLISIDSTADAIQDTAYLRLLEPKKDSLNKMLDVVIGHAREDMRVHQPECTMLNWATDALYEMARQVYSGQVDFAITNIGGIRCNWQAGDITLRHVYELMPFDNRLVILSMQGSDITELCNIFAMQGGQGVSRQLRMEIADGKVRNIRLNGKKIVPEAVYYVATSDYLSTGADHFTPLTKAIDKTDTHRKIRDLYIEYIKQNPEVKSTTDGRMKITN